MDNEKQDWYFTFGSNHEYAYCYTVIKGTREEAREQMVEMYGLKWAFQYPRDHWVKEDGRTQAEHYNLTEI